MNATLRRFASFSLAMLGLLAADAGAQPIRGRTSSAPIRGMTPIQPVMPATVGRQNTMPLQSPMNHSFIGRSVGRSFYTGLGYYGYGYGGYGWGLGNYGYIDDYGGGQTININVGGGFPIPYSMPRNFAVPPPVEPERDCARLTLTVPVGAEVFIGDHRVEMNGTTRTIESPELRPGETFTFDVHVSWTEKRKVVEEKRRVTMKAGERQSLQYNAPAATGPVKIEL